MATLSLCLIVKDEEKFLEDCLRSLNTLVDEIIIVDNGSRDNTKRIAKQFTDKIFDLDIEGDFSKLRNFSLDQAQGDWIFVMDADELISEEDKGKILKIINDKKNNDKEVIGFKFDQRTYNLKKDVKPIKTTDKVEIRKHFEGLTSSKLVRLFRNNSKIRFRNKVHELVEKSIKENNGEVVETDIILHHFSMIKGQEFYSDRLAKYIDLIWLQLEKEPENPRYNYQAAQAFLERGKKDLALKYLLRTVKFDPDYPAIYSDIAKIFMELGKLRDAIKFFNESIKREPETVSAYNNLAFIYAQLNKLSTAKKLLEIAIKKDPENKCVKENYNKLNEKINNSVSKTSNMRRNHIGGQAKAS